MKLLDVVHPAAKTLVDVSLSQDAEVSKICGGRGEGEVFREEEVSLGREGALPGMSECRKSRLDSRSGWDGVACAGGVKE